MSTVLVCRRGAFLESRGRNRKVHEVNVNVSNVSLQDVAAETGKKFILFGRFMLPDQSEHACRLRNITPDDAEIISETEIGTGTHIVAYIDDIGRLEGIVTGCMPDGFVLGLRLPRAGRERIFKRLQWLRDKALGKAVEQRRHERYSPKDSKSVITLPDGRSYPCEVLDISLSGASVKTQVLPEIGTHVMLGRMHGRMVRYHDQGIAVEFVRLMEQNELDAQIRKP